MESEQPAKPRLIKYKVFGPKNSGRKSLVFRYSQNAFKRDEVPTFDIDFMVKILNKNLKIKNYFKDKKIFIYIKNGSRSSSETSLDKI